MATGETQLQLCLYIAVIQLHEIQHKQKARCRAEKQKGIGKAEFAWRGSLLPGNTTYSHWC